MCEEAKSLVGAFTSVSKADGHIKFQFSIGNSLAQHRRLGQNSLEISAELEILPILGGTEVCVFGRSSPFPAREAYYGRAGQTETIYQRTQLPIGVLGLALPDTGLRGCS